jgi:methyl-accepting chemotaxis protein
MNHHFLFQRLSILIGNNAYNNGFLDGVISSDKYSRPTVKDVISLMKSVIVPKAGDILKRRKFSSDDVEGDNYSMKEEVKEVKEEVKEAIDEVKEANEEVKEANEELNRVPGDEQSSHDDEPDIHEVIDLTNED